MLQIKVVENNKSYSLHYAGKQALYRPGKAIRALGG
jgi:hypothetical protein